MRHYKKEDPWISTTELCQKRCKLIRMNEEKLKEILHDHYNEK